MKTETGNIYPIIVSQPSEKSLRNVSASRLPSDHLKEQVARVNRIELEYDPFEQKGIYIDIYI